MLPLKGLKCIESESTIGDLKKCINRQSIPYIPVFQNNKNNIVAIAYPRDLLRLGDEAPLRPNCRPPWFITASNSILEIIKEFRQNSQSLAIVLNKKGDAIGVLTLDAIVDEIFCHAGDEGADKEEERKILVDRSFPGGTKVKEINEWLCIDLPVQQEDETLEELMSQHLGRRPDLEETVRLGHFELSLEATSLIAGRTILIRSIG